MFPCTSAQTALMRREESGASINIFYQLSTIHHSIAFHEYLPILIVDISLDKYSSHVIKNTQYFSTKGIMEKHVEYWLTHSDQFAGKCNNEFAMDYLKRIKEMRSWLKKQIVK